MKQFILQLVYLEIDSFSLNQSKGEKDSRHTNIHGMQKILGQRIITSTKRFYYSKQSRNAKDSKQQRNQKARKIHHS